MQAVKASVSDIQGKTILPRHGNIGYGWMAFHRTYCTKSWVSPSSSSKTPFKSTESQCDQEAESSLRKDLGVQPWLIQGLYETVAVENTKVLLLQSKTSEQWKFIKYHTLCFSLRKEKERSKAWSTKLKGEALLHFELKVTVCFNNVLEW